jgi:phospholipid/cholesterol/gamma-HCH transport system substrate-binding protein
MSAVVLRRRVQGVVFLLMVLTLLALSVAKFSGAFDSGVMVTVQADRTGLLLDRRSDVKVRGLVVGEVTEVGTSGGHATVRLRLEPELVELIPANVSARLLPKTLFGEKYVSLVLPERPAARPLAEGDVIPVDRSRTARELDAALDGLLPLLQAVQPQQLAGTLGAIAMAVQGRGAQLGDTLVRQQQLVSGLNTALPELQEDISRIADLAETYAEAGPDLAAALADLTTTSRTVAEQRHNLAALFDSVTRVSDDLRGFLTANQDNLIALAADSRPTLETLARYAPEYPCLLGQLTRLVPKVDQATGVGTDEPGLHVVLRITPSRGKYLPGVDEPRNTEDRGPRCYPVVEGQPLSGLPNSPAEQRFIAALLASAGGEQPAEIPPWSSFLVGPLLRGAEVTVR